MFTHRFKAQLLKAVVGAGGHESDVEIETRSDGYLALLYVPYPEYRITAHSEEHGWSIIAIPGEHVLASELGVAGTPEDLLEKVCLAVSPWLDTVAAEESHRISYRRSETLRQETQKLVAQLEGDQADLADRVWKTISKLEELVEDLQQQVENNEAKIDVTDEQLNLLKRDVETLKRARASMNLSVALYRLVFILAKWSSDPNAPALVAGARKLLLGS